MKLRQDGNGQDELFGDAATHAPTPRSTSVVLPATPASEVIELAARCRERYSERLRFGTSSWSFPGWAGFVWAHAYSPPMLSRHGLTAYSQHPLLGSVCLDRSFYRPLDAATYAAYAAQVPAGFRFVVKVAALVADATTREPDSGKALQPNRLFLDPRAALHECALPALQGLGSSLGVLLFQLSPLPARWLNSIDELIARLETVWQAVLPALPPSVHAALEVRDAALLVPALAASLKSNRVGYCLGLHDRMPPLAEQLPMLRAMWPGDLVCRWNLQRGMDYDAAKNLFEPFDRLQAPDVATREALARVIAATLAAGYSATVTINNKAEGSAPLSVIELARQVVQAGA